MSVVDLANLDNLTRRKPPMSSPGPAGVDQGDAVLDIPPNGVFSGIGASVVATQMVGAHDGYASMEDAREALSGLTAGPAPAAVIWENEDRLYARGLATATETIVSGNVFGFNQTETVLEPYELGQFGETRISVEHGAALALVDGDTFAPLQK
ncbi:MAG: hypothetical protein JWO69_108 [Thermoleophilia bacterium]|jgi:hypothetical protein|nr:hypothetical protein [Thermoleophilia bacterium]